MKRKLTALRVILPLIAAVLALTVSAGEIKPGVERWGIKTSVPPNANLEHPVLITFQDLATLPDPVAHPKRNDKNFDAARFPAFENTRGIKEGDIVAVQGWLHLVASEEDGDYHAQISNSPTSGDDCVVVEIPIDDPRFVPSPELRAKLESVRHTIDADVLKGKKAGSGGRVIKPAIHVEVAGQLFFDDSHVGDKPRGKKGMKAITLWELHPVTVITVLQ